MKNEFPEGFGVEEKPVTVIRHPLNTRFLILGSPLRKQRVGLTSRVPTRRCSALPEIKPYKGYRVPAARILETGYLRWATPLITAGELQKGRENYLDSLVQATPLEQERGRIILQTQFIPAKGLELYLKAADLPVLPYKSVKLRANNKAWAAGREPVNTNW